ncbi:hypothetical protein BJY52DRAFT_1229801 [Lactarius psammicola]|nr:hypothetical protein BJY52DRAFT_1229801 [Lactarius psammicola]
MRKASGPVQRGSRVCDKEDVARQQCEGQRDGGRGVDGKCTRKQASRMMRGTVEVDKPRDIVRTQPTNLISTLPHTHPPPSCGRPAASSSHAPNPLRMGYDHPAHTPDAFCMGYDNPACIPDALRMGYNNPARTPNSPSHKAVCRGTTRPPSPPPIAYAGRTTPAPQLTHPACSHTCPFVRMLWAQERWGAVHARGAPGMRGGATQVANGPGLHHQCRVFACAQRLEDAQAGRDGEGWGATQGKAAREQRGRRMCKWGMMQPGRGLHAKPKGVGTLSTPSRPVNQLRKINVK